jgi:predicted acyl esterase
VPASATVRSQELLQPGELVKFLRIQWAAWQIPAEAPSTRAIAPLNSPISRKNYNTGGRISYEKPQEARTAHIRIYHDARHASRLLLPLAAP